MTDALSRLKAALSSRYTIERELGSGGMATVYLAEDLKLHRPVAIKVLRTELAAALGPDRFLREIEIAPHMLPLLDSGEADGLLFYVMPYVEGESLRDAPDAAWVRDVIAWLIALPALDGPEIVVQRFGGKFDVDDHNPYRIEFWLTEAVLPPGVSVRMSRGRVLRILVISFSNECAVTLADVEPLVEDLPARFEVNHADFEAGPHVTGTTHSFRVPAGTLHLRFRMPQRGGAYGDAVRAAYAGHAEPKPTLPELLESMILSVSEKDRHDTWEGVPSLRQLRNWSGS